MNIESLTRQGLRDLLDAGTPPCITIYLPLSRDGAQLDQDRIRLKNQIREVERVLESRDINKSDQESLLEPLEAVLDSEVIRGGGPAGVALFRATDTFELIELPETTRAIAMVSNTFHVKPLLPLVNQDQHFRVLALSQNEVRLFAGDRYAFRELSLPELPPSQRPGSAAPTEMAGALGDDDDNDDETVQYHTGAGRRPAVFHGQANVKEDEKQRILRFCQLVDHAVRDCFDDEDTPLILAAPEPLPGIYRQASAYRNLHNAVISGDPRQQNEQTLHDQAWDLVAPRSTSSHDRALSELHEALPKDRGTLDVGNATTAAEHGRIATLLLPGASTSENENAARAAAVDDVDGEERLNHVLANTLRHGGDAFVVPADDLPAHAPLGAVFRY